MLKNSNLIHINWKENALTSTRYGRLMVSLVFFYALLTLTGLLDTANTSSFYCSGWPLCAPSDAVGWFALLHRISTGFVVLITGYVLFQSWTHLRSYTSLLVLTTTFAILFSSQALLGSQFEISSPLYFKVIHRLTAVITWLVLLVSVGLLFLNQSIHQSTFSTVAHTITSLSPSPERNSKLFIRDLFQLTKPIVVLLLLVTTFAGMVIGLRGMPELSLVFWTLLSGFMAAGGSGAINQYIDRNDDSKMQRTQNRPIPAGRLTPGEGLAFGIALVIASFYIMVAFVNLLAALLTLVGIVYYVLFYSLILKKSTVQNIVIGGGAGAIPPLVGWAAVTGSLDITSLFLFLVVFMWTPPHFWALALVRRKDYARAGVPMLPVVRGESNTRWQVLLYTLILVGITLLLPVIGLGSWVYLAGAIVLGLWLISSAYRLWKSGGNKLAWKMYRYSSMYLAFLFLVLMLDRLLV